jgi:phosphatidylserine/phosphatidylglycerophosphate/cardiolipin synthase-like enzyme
LSASNEQQINTWWADGDTPVRADSHVLYCIDARSTLLTMCRRFLTAHTYIHLAGWGITPHLRLVRGTDHRAGSDGSPEQEALLADLRAQGLRESEIDFWCLHELTVEAVLGYAASKGVEVYVLLWYGSRLFSHYDYRAVREHLTQVSVTCILDDSAFDMLHHPLESLHQKMAVVDGTHAFVGGIDPLVEAGGDFDRWDVPFHRYYEEESSPHPWHDVHALIEGPAVGDVERNFRQRWNDVVERHQLDKQLFVAEHPLPPPLASESLVQIARTIPPHTYRFAPKQGIQGIAQHYVHALSNAQHVIYLENQYFWSHIFYGIDNPFLGTPSPDMEHIIHELGAALRRGVTVIMVLPDRPNVGRAFTDAGLVRLRDEAPEAVEQGRMQVFCLSTSADIDGRERYRSIYVHAKVGIVDDLWSTVGSANLNNRGMRDDAEMNVATLNAELARGLRLLLWAEHLGLMSKDDLLPAAHHLSQQPQRSSEDERAASLLQRLQQQLGDPLSGLRLMSECAQSNLRRYKANQPLVGHLLPYLTAEEAKQQGLHFREAYGWIEGADRSFINIDYQAQSIQKEKSH